jgi:hypothetical protein
MSEYLFKAIYSYYKATPANAFFTATSGQLEYSVAKDRWKDNFAVMQGTGENPDNMFRTDIDDVYFQINVFSSNRGTCWDLMAKCRALFDRANLTVTSHYNTTLHREAQVLPLWNEDDNLWQATIEFRCKLQPT